MPTQAVMAQEPDLALLPQSNLEAVLCGQIPGSHIAVLAAGDQGIAPLNECLQAGQGSAHRVTETVPGMEPHIPCGLDPITY